MTLQHTAFVPDGDSRKDTAVLLVGTAEEYGIDQSSIKAVQGGFRITEELADVLYSDTKESEPETEPETAPVKDETPKKSTNTKSTKKSTSTKSTKSTKKPSGNRAAKNVTTKE